jgi:hypothetical protein
MLIGTERKGRGRRGKGKGNGEGDGGERRSILASSASSRSLKSNSISSRALKTSPGAMVLRFARWASSFALLEM